MKSPETNRHVIAKTRFGSVAVIWENGGNGPGILQILLSKPGLRAETIREELFPRSLASACGLVDDLAARISVFLDGADPPFPLEPLRLDRCPAFQRRALLAEYGIPRGRVSTYSRIAAHLGVPRGARAVGNALATNPFPIVIPCHRAIRSDGMLGGYQGGLAMKRELLMLEGVDVDRRGRVITADLFY